MNARRLLLSLFFSSFFIATSAQATSSITYTTPVTYTFGGTLNNVSLGLWPQFAAGSPFAGSFTFEATATDGDPGPIRGIYGPGPAFEVTIAGLKFSSPGGGPGSVMVINDIAPGLDQLSAAADVAVGPAINSAIADMFHIQLQDSQGTAFASDLLLPTPVDLNDFEVARFELFFFDTDSLRPSWAMGSLDYLSLSTPSPSVPEPATLALVALALIGLTRKRYSSSPSLPAENSPLSNSLP